VVSLLRHERRERQAPARTLAVFADPVFEKDDERLRHPLTPAGPASLGAAALARATREAGLLPGSMRLPFTGREAKAILDLVHPQDRKAALGFEATRTAATSPDLADYRFVHFATHGFVNGTRPELSGLVLSLVDPRGQAQDGFLSAPDIFNLRLTADLVVLSGCRTALGKEVRGEGLVGLTRAFMYAGAGDVVASLWNVDDAATAELMRRFYGGMLGPRRMSPAAALRAAQRSMWTSPRWRAPYYWSGFLIQGDWK
jgi:CHAT domain-containing protein